MLFLACNFNPRGCSPFKVLCKGMVRNIGQWTVDILRFCKFVAICRDMMYVLIHFLSEAVRKRVLKIAFFPICSKNFL